METIWFVITGALLIGFALAGTELKRLPVTPSLFYLIAGAWLGPWGVGLLHIDALDDTAMLERLTEIAVIISLFTAGLKLRLPITDRRWRVSMALAGIAMVLTIAGITTFGIAIGLPLAAALLLGAILAPTDPVLASDVQVNHEHDSEPVRFSLTGEAGLNDGTAFPFVMLGLGLMGHHELGVNGWHWWSVDLVWAVVAGLGVGTLCGAGIARLVIYLRREHKEAVGLDEFLALGLIALSYGVALLIGGYGFLAVFAAGLSVRRVEREHAEVTPSTQVKNAANLSAEEQATNPGTAPAYMASAVLGFNEQLERLGELAVVVVVGSMLARIDNFGPGLWLAFILFVIIRPLATTLTLLPTRLSRAQRAFIAWFGVRGVGSIYYLAFALSHGVDGPLARQLVDLTLVVVASSIVLHGVSVTPLMQLYSSRRGRR